MTPVAGALTITFTNQYVGPHRVCYRRMTPVPTNPSEPCTVLTSFCCVTVATGPGTGTNTVTIPVIVDNESCDSATWEVYVQAECEDIATTDGRVYVTPNPGFTPTPTCLPVTYTCNEVPLAGFIITDDGRTSVNGGGYTGAETVSVGGDTSGTLTVGIGDPNDLLITNPGSGAATDATYLGVPLTGGSGTGATATVVITGGVVAGITSLGTALTPYVVGDILGVDQTYDPGLTGLVGEAITVVEIDTGTVTGISFTPPPGTLYTSPPAVVIAAGTTPPSQATATAVLGLCDKDWDLGTQCDSAGAGAYGPMPIEIALGQSFDLCYQNGTSDATLPAGFTEGPSSECCYDCVDVTFTNGTANTISYMYVDCFTKQVESGTLTTLAGITLECVVNNSWAFSTDDPAVVVNTTSPPTCTPIIIT